ncbi:glucose-6-phosphate isomerase [Paenibacillus sp. IB182496]|uniref:glucose-6-phosphate isomerase n=1 Tax=Paenibacillus sabuli TaxID=2772509 RepID=A0A927GTK6_9BACL|nr:glucose-6-phosphate isomerase family protein [Paenibacillus sabuli]MBD2847441.1 glucose-6-phosphate isomerase [Paenibacillus sabuli]
MDKCFSIPLKPADYKSYGALVTRRTLSQLKALYVDQAAVERLLEDGDPTVYEVYELPYPNDETDLLANITVLHPGQVGDEFFMTKGHFHGEPDTAEAVIGIAGRGEMLIQHRGGELRSLLVAEGYISYSPGGWGHRVINSGDEELVFFAVSGANIRHDYETAARLNFKAPEQA